MVIRHWNLCEGWDRSPAKVETLADVQYVSALGPFFPFMKTFHLLLENVRSILQTVGELQVI